MAVSRRTRRCRSGARVESTRERPAEEVVADVIHLALLAAAKDIGGVEELQVPARDDVARAVDFEQLLGFKW